MWPSQRRMSQNTAPMRQSRQRTSRYDCTWALAWASSSLSTWAESSRSLPNALSSVLNSSLYHLYQLTSLSPPPHTCWGTAVGVYHWRAAAQADEQRRATGTAWRNMYLSRNIRTRQGLRQGTYASLSFLSLSHSSYSLTFSLYRFVSLFIYLSIYLFRLYLSVHSLTRVARLCLSRILLSKASALRKKSMTTQITSLSSE